MYMTYLTPTRGYLSQEFNGTAHSATWIHRLRTCP